MVFAAHHGELTAALHTLGHRVRPDEHRLLLAEVDVYDSLVWVEVQLQGRFPLRRFMYCAYKCIQPLFLLLYGPGGAMSVETRTQPHNTQHDVLVIAQRCCLFMIWILHTIR